MANSYTGNVAYIDTVTSDINVGTTMFGLADAPVIVTSIRFYNPTQNDVCVVKDNAGNVVAQLKANATNQDLSEDFGGTPLRCQGLKLLTADQTKNSGNILITFK